MICSEFEKNHEDLIGKTVWICDYRFTDIAQKPIRHVKPTEVLVVRNDDLPAGKTIYYADIHFRPIGRNGQPLKKIIAPYDNTGYRFFSGTSVNIFLTEQECVKCYLEQCAVIKKQIKWERKTASERLNKIEFEIDEMIEEFTDKNSSETQTIREVGYTWTRKEWEYEIVSKIPHASEDGIFVYLISQRQLGEESYKYFIEEY